MSRATAGRAATAAVLAAGWTLAAWLLWRSSVVPSLHLPHLDEHAYFSSSELKTTTRQSTRMTTTRMTMTMTAMTATTTAMMTRRRIRMKTATLIR